MDVVAYVPDYNEKLAEVVLAMAAGIPGCEIRRQGDYRPSDVAVVFGGVKNCYAPTHSKREVLEKHQGRRLLMLEAAFVKRVEYYQAGWGGAAGLADFNAKDAPADRWESFGISTRSWQRREGPILVCGQLLRDTQVQDTNHAGWCRDTVQALLDIGESVIFRPHPREDAGVYGVPSDLHHTGKIADALSKAKATVIWNSTSGVDSLIAGVPVIAMHRSAIVHEVAQHKLKAVRSLRYPSRRAFFNKLGYAQWTLDEMRQGIAWRHLTG